MIAWIIEWSAKHRWIVVAATLILTVWALDSMRKTPLDAVPDLSDPQVIIFTDWMGRSPDLVEDQVTYPLVRALQSTPGVSAVRGYSMFGMSFIYVIFTDGTDIYWARTRVFEQLGRVQQLLPPGVTPTLGPDASGVGWVFQYVLEDTTGRLDPAELRTLQDFTVRPALQAVPGVAEIASLGGFERQYQILIDPERLTTYGITLGDITRAVQGANAEVGARVLEQAGREFILRGRGYVRTLQDLEASVVTVTAGGNPIRLKDVARVQFGPDIRRGAADWNGTGEAVGGIVVMRIGSNALEVIRAVKTQVAALTLPDGVKLVPTYDRSELILGAIGTLRDTLIEESIVVAVICLVFLMHAGSAAVVMIILPLAVLFSFIAMHFLGLTSNIMSLGGIAIAMGELTDAAIVLIENAHTRLAVAPPGADRRRVIIDACKEVGSPIFYSLLLITVSFLPIFHFGRAGRALVCAARLYEDVCHVRGGDTNNYPGSSAYGLVLARSHPNRSGESAESCAGADLQTDCPCCCAMAHSRRIAERGGYRCDGASNDEARFGVHAPARRRIVAGNADHLSRDLYRRGQTRPDHAGSHHQELPRGPICPRQDRTSGDSDRSSTTRHE